MREAGGREMKQKTIKLKIGDKVKMVNCREAKTYEGVVWKCVSEPWDCCGAKIIKLNGKSGGFDVSCLEKIEEENI